MALNSRKHGLTNTPTYYAWKAMRHRCQNPRHRAYEWYGARGISVDPRWEDFSVFLADMGEKPPGMSLDRIDNDGGYSPGNCRWATAVEQGRNRRGVRVTPAIVESVFAARLEGATQREIAEAVGIAQSNVSNILNRKAWAN